MSTVRFVVVNIGTLSMNKFWGETERVRSPTATCTLLQSGDQRLLVDPSPYPEELEATLFARTGLRPADIGGVFVTHFHGDHRFGLDLFPRASWLMAEQGLKEWQEQLAHRAAPEVARDAARDAAQMERIEPAEGRLPEGISLFPSPGHTYGHHSLVAATPWGKLIVSGDAVMTYDWFEAEEGYHNCVDFDRATETIRRIKRTADWVIPGHGNYFPA
jgi:glyoxylase-like metal-dependent hydrolase (beta-lactamase superfamily II)